MLNNDSQTSTCFLLKLHGYGQSHFDLKLSISVHLHHHVREVSSTWHALIGCRRRSGRSCSSYTAADPQHNYLSISTPLLSQGALLSYGLSSYTMKMVKQVCSDAVEIVEPAKEGYQLTLKLNFAKVPSGKDSEKVITQISSVQAVILSSQLKEMLRNVNSQDTSQGMNKPIKLVYHPREPFYIIRQELMDVGSSEKWAKAPPCTWSPIPPPELRGEPLEDLSTNGGFVSFDISSCHVEGKKLDKTVWGLLNFYAYVKKHVKVLHEEKLEENGNVQKVKVHAESRYGGKLIRLSKPKNFKRRCRDFTRKIMQIRFRIKIHGFQHFRRRWLTIPKFSSPLGYTKLE
uniref:Uncharacterized protein n=1 Tax=Salix viminalis TaxID=40686 RepID=A0A6N2N809_SALVM